VRRGGEVESAPSHGSRRNRLGRGSGGAVKAIRNGSGYAGIAALKISRMLPVELFAQSSDLAWVNGLPFPTIEHYTPAVARPCRDPGQPYGAVGNPVRHPVLPVP